MTRTVPRQPRRPWAVSLHPRHLRAALGVLMVVAVCLDLAAATGLASLAGFGEVQHVLAHINWIWLARLAGSLVISFAGYYLAYRGILAVADGHRMSWSQLWAVAIAGFGGFLAHRGGNLDQYALEAAGADPAEARVRVNALAGLEYGVLSIGGCATAIAVLVAGRPIQLGFTIPWAVAPVPGFLIAFWLARRYQRLTRDQPGWRGIAGSFLESVRLIRELFAHPLRWGWAWLGMTVFWAGDAFAVWAGLAMYGYSMDGAALFVGFATGAVFTRRTGPLAGAGVLTLILPLAIWACGAPLAVAVAGVFAYRVLAFWLPMPASLAALPTLRAMAGTRRPLPGDN